MRSKPILGTMLLALTACSHSLDGPSPVVTALDPPLVCNAVTTTLTITGSGLSPLAVDALTGDPELVLPTITVQRTEDLDGNPVTDAPITIPDDPENPAGSKVHWISQTSMSFDVDPALGLLPGFYVVTVTNANGKSFTATGILLEVVAPPELTDVTPSTICTGGGDIVITGTGFSSHATVTIGSTPATVTAVTSTMVTATVPAGLTPGTYDVIVDNGAGCIDTLVGALTIVPGPAVFFVDPPDVWNGVSVQATIYVSGIDATPASVSMRPSGTMDAPTVLDATWDPLAPNKIQATIPAGLTTGPWDVTVDDGSCRATLPMGVTVVDTLVVAVDGIDPPFGWTEEDTAVTITAIDPPPAGQVQFVATPRAYLNPDVTGPGTVATPLSAVAFVDATRLTAIVPAGLPAGLYDLIVVNPDGSVGLADKAFTVTAIGAPPPIIGGLTPASVVNQTGQTVTISGQNFRNPIVTATCQDDAGIVTIVDGVVTASTGTSIDVTFDMSAFTNGGVCVIRVTNDDGTYADFSALAVTNPAQNLPATVLDDAMVTARRALGATAGRVTAQARFVYAIGGDDGTDAGLLTSVEAAPVDLFGALSPWATLPGTLPEGRSFTTAVSIGRFLYLVGGRDGGGATDSVLRAHILDPRAAPSIDDLAFDYATAGLDPGLYYYRVAAVMAPADASNPGGEGLPSDPLSVIVPPAAGQKVVLTLFWTAVPGAVAYRLYRTPSADMLLGDARLLAEIPAATIFTDDGSVAPGAGLPLPTGALGVWHEASPLGVAREGAGVTFAQNPIDPNGYFLYAIGGRDAAGAALTSYDFAAVTVAPDGSQTMGAFTDVPAFLTAGRWQLGAVAMDHLRASVVPDGQTWIYAMSGLNAAGTSVVSDVTAGQVSVAGTLTPIFEVDDMTPARAGFGFAGANNFLVAFGGASSLTGTPTAGTLSAKMCAVGEAGCGGMPVIPEPPDLVNWNAIGFTLQQARYLPGSALESAFIFLLGGASDAAAATATVERTHW